MVHAMNEFTNVTKLRSEAVGEPGSRTFRMLVESGSSSAVIWIEHQTTNYNASWLAVDRNTGHVGIDHFSGA